MSDSTDPAQSPSFDDQSGDDLLRLWRERSQRGMDTDTVQQLRKSLLERGVDWTPPRLSKLRAAIMVIALAFGVLSLWHAYYLWDPHYVSDDVTYAVRLAWLMPSGEQFAPEPRTRTFESQKQLDEALEATAAEIVNYSFFLRVTTGLLLLVFVSCVWLEARYDLVAITVFAVLLLTGPFDILHLDKFHIVRAVDRSVLSGADVYTLDDLWTILIFVPLLASALGVVAARWQRKELLPRV